MIKLPYLALDKPAPPSRAVDVGWLLDTEKASVVWEAPRRVSRNETPPEHAKAVSYCPAVVDHEARMFEVLCPIDVNLGFRFDDQGKPALVNLDGDRSAIRPKALNDMLAIIGRREWRHPDRPIIQLITPYIFLADQPVYMTQLPPLIYYHMNKWPGVMVGGRLPIHIWPRQMMWAFEWFETNRPLSLRRGEPWFFVRFETEDPSRPVRLFEAEWTDELREYKTGISAVANYMNRTFSLFKTAEARRPKTLLKRKVRR
jgi:hypothetical protein